MTRLTSLAMIVALIGTARAQSQADIAAKLNEDGKELMYGNKFAEAAKKFQEAVARVPEAKYFLNLCLARFQEGKFDEALTACNAVALNNPSDAVKTKADKVIVKINDTARSQNIELHPGGGGGGDPGKPENPPDPGQRPDPSRPPDPTHPTQPVSYAPAVGRPPEQNLAIAVAPDNHYTWTLGVDVFGGGGRVGRADYYGSVVAGIRLKSDYMLDQALRLGGEGYLQISHLGQGKNDMLTAETLDIFDVGLALYKHACLGGTPRLCVTPLAGVHLSLMSPAKEMDAAGSQVFNYAGVGGRGELAFEFAFGPRYEHVLSLMLGVNVYSPVLSGPSAADPNSLTIAEAGLDQGGATGYLGLGYTYRFNTPLGSTPFVTLE